MSLKLSDFRKLWKEELLEDVRREISGVIQPLKADLAAMNKKMNDLETSQKFLAEKLNMQEMTSMTFTFASMRTSNMADVTPWRSKEFLISLTIILLS